MYFSSTFLICCMKVGLSKPIFSNTGPPRHLLLMSIWHVCTLSCSPIIHIYLFGFILGRLSSKMDTDISL